jgi:hypothetical protein
MYISNPTFLGRDQAEASGASPELVDNFLFYCVSLGALSIELRR